MSLVHEFFLVPNTVGYKEFMKLYMNNSHSIESIDLPDDLIQYISDSLNWIPSKNPAISMTRKEKGVNLFGVTLFDQTSAEVMKNVFSAWYLLFTNSPEKVELTGEFIFSANNKELGGRELLVFERKEVLELLEKFILMIEKLKDGNLYLYHLGI